MLNHPDFIKEFYAVDKHYEYPKSKADKISFEIRFGGSGLGSSEGKGGSGNAPSSTESSISTSSEHSLPKLLLFVIVQSHKWN
jgi:hypothetical protein